MYVGISELGVHAPVGEHLDGRRIGHAVGVTLPTGESRAAVGRSGQCDVFAEAVGGLLWIGDDAAAARACCAESELRFGLSGSQIDRHVAEADVGMMGHQHNGAAAWLAGDTGLLKVPRGGFGLRLGPDLETVGRGLCQVGI